MIDYIDNLHYDDYDFSNGILVYEVYKSLDMPKEDK
jgi:hypothetical protein